MNDFALYLAALNRILFALGRPEVDEERAGQYHQERLSVEQAVNLEMIEQDLEALNGARLSGD